MSLLEIVFLKIKQIGEAAALNNACLFYVAVYLILAYESECSCGCQPFDLIVLYEARYEHHYIMLKKMPHIVRKLLRLLEPVLRDIEHIIELLYHRVALVELFHAVVVKIYQ